MDKNVNEYLNSVLETHSRSKIVSLLNDFNEQRRKVAEFMQREFGTRLAGSPVNSGSYAKNTDVNIQFDLDLVVPFQHNDSTHWNPKKIKSEVYGALQREYPGKVTNKKIAVGIEFPTERGLIEIDVVPGMEARNQGYQEDSGSSEDKDLVLFNREVGRNVKTNIHKQIEVIKGSEMEIQRRVIRMLKVWKKTQQTPVSSFELELLVRAAFDQNGNPNTESPGELLYTTLDTLQSQLPDLQRLKLIDPGTGKDLEFLPTREKRLDLAERFKRILRSVDKGPDQLKEHIPVNQQFVQPKSKGTKFGGTFYA